MRRSNFIEEHAAPWVGALLLIFLAVYSCSSDAASVNVNWTHDQTSCDYGNETPPAVPSPEDCPTTGFILSTATSETGTFTPIATLTSATARTHTLSNVRAGRRCYRMTATSSGGESKVSNVSCLTVPFLPPKAPVVTVTIAITTPPP